MRVRILPLLLALLPTACSTWYGPRVDLFDDGVERVVGMNLTLYDRGLEPKEEVLGVAAGLWRPDVASVKGLTVGLAPRSPSLHGVTVGLLHACGDDLVGINAGGLLLQGEERLAGLNAGLSVGAGRDVYGLTLAPLLFTPYRFRNADEADAPHADGVTLAGLRAEYPRFRGVVGSLLVRAGDVAGLVVGVLEARVRGTLRGVSIGLVNRSHRLRGVQLGLLNRVADRPGWRRWMPLLRIGWDASEGTDGGPDEPAAGASPPAAP